MPDQKFVNVTFAIPEEYFDLAYAAFNDFNTAGVEEHFDSMIVCFEISEWTEAVKEQISSTLREFSVPFSIESETIVQQQNWNEEWEKSLQPVVISDRIAITPDWAVNQVADKEIVAIVNPKMSFGTGYHPTTRMVANFMEQFVKPNSDWVDIGTGTGVLAIIAIKLGASSVFAFDNDEWSVENSEENFQKNEVSGKVRLEKADIFTVEIPSCDGVVANLYRNLLIPNFQKIRVALMPGSPLIISGVLKYDNQEIISEAVKAGFTHIETKTEDEWSAIVFNA